jgi:hypothetical protein
MGDVGSIRAGRAFVEIAGDDRMLAEALKTSEAKMKAWAAKVSQLDASGMKGSSGWLKALGSSMRARDDVTALKGDIAEQARVTGLRNAWAVRTEAADKARLATQRLLLAEIEETGVAVKVAQAQMQLGAARGRAAELGMLGALKAQFGKGSESTLLTKTLAGGGAILGLSLAAGAVERATAAIVENLKDANNTAADMYLNFVRSIPILGDVEKTLENIGTIVDEIRSPGQAAYVAGSARIAQITDQLEMLEKLNTANTDYDEERIKSEAKWAAAKRDYEEAASVAGTSMPVRHRILAKMEKLAAEELDQINQRELRAQDKDHEAEMKEWKDTLKNEKKILEDRLEQRRDSANEMLDQLAIEASDMDEFERKRNEIRMSDVSPQEKDKAYGLVKLAEDKAGQLKRETIGEANKRNWGDVEEARIRLQFKDDEFKKDMALLDLQRKRAVEDARRHGLDEKIVNEKFRLERELLQAAKYTADRAKAEHGASTMGGYARGVSLAQAFGSGSSGGGIPALVKAVHRSNELLDQIRKNAPIVGP